MKNTNVAVEITYVMYDKRLRVIQIHVSLVYTVLTLVLHVDIAMMFQIQYKTDENECATGKEDCEQICTNTEGSFECSCTEGFELISRNLCTGGFVLVNFLMQSGFAALRIC